jgi:hypothetical protein
MSLVSIQIPNLIQGVSQQPQQMRLPSQLQEQTNAYPSLVDGLTKRPPTQFVARLATDAATQFVHFINRDAIERYVVRVTGSSLSVYELDGTQKNVYAAMTGTTAFSFPTYLNSPSDIRAITIADYTFLVNRAKTVAMKATTSPSPDSTALVTIIQGAYKSKYEVVLKVGSTNYTYNVTVWNGQGTLTAPQVDVTPGAIADGLISAINAATATHGCTASLVGQSTFKLVNTTTPAFTVKVSCSGGDDFINCAKTKVARLSDLPMVAPNGFIIGVGSDIEDATTGDYYATFIANDGSSGSGRWQETVGFGVKTTLDEATMPYVLVRRSDGHFACMTAAWNTRQAGDDATAPVPSFIGRKLKDVFLFRNRLGFVTDDKVILSEAGQYFNFFRTTTTQVVNSDPIDISVGHSKIASLQAAVPWDSRLILFSDLSQFSLGSGMESSLTPETVEVIHTTEYENQSSNCRPAATGRSILFVQSKGSSCGVREYIRIDSSEKYDGVDITANVPSYVSGTPKQLALSTHDSTAFLRTSEGLWNYKWFINGSEKVQSAWSKWDIGSGAVVVGMEWFDQVLYMAVTRGSATFLEKVEFPGRFKDTNMTWGVHLDRRFSGTVVAGTAGATSKVAMPTNITYASAPTVVIDGVQRLVDSYDSSWVYLSDQSGALVGKTAFVGLPYSMSWTFSRPFVRNGDKPIIDGRLQLTYGSLAFEDTGHFAVTVTPRYRDPFTYVFDGGYLGSNLSLGSPFLDTRTFRYPVHCRAEDVTVSVSSTSFLPCRIQSASFEGKYTSRSQPV